MRLAIAKPSPVPRWAVFRDCQYASKILDCSSDEMPGPVSRKENLHDPSTIEELILTRPFEGVNLIAFPIRFIRTCNTFSRSMFTTAAPARFSQTILIDLLRAST